MRLRSRGLPPIAAALVALLALVGATADPKAPDAGGLAAEPPRSLDAMRLVRRRDRTVRCAEVARPGGETSALPGRDHVRGGDELLDLLGLAGRAGELLLLVLCDGKDEAELLPALSALELVDRHGGPSWKVA
jgi:hypothetical protein